MFGNFSSGEKPELFIIVGLVLVLGILVALPFWVYWMWQARPDAAQRQTQTRIEQPRQSQQCAEFLKSSRIVLRVEQID